MKLSDFSKIKVLSERRAKLRATLAACERGVIEAIVTYSGIDHDIAAVVPVADIRRTYKDLLRVEIGSVEAELRSMGVEIDD